jgi:guanylate kinase
MEDFCNMSKFSIAFIKPTEQNELRHRIIESADQETALKTFFNEEAVDCYSADDQGYFYFKEDFFDKTVSTGSVIQCD